MDLQNDTAIAYQNAPPPLCWVRCGKGTVFLCCFFEYQGEFGCGRLPRVTDGFRPVCANCYSCFIQSDQTADVRPAADCGSS